jgi:GNAT superfamily N-acetyltransferase
MGRALVDDPLFVHVLPDPEQRISGVPLMMASLLRIGLAQGEVWATPPPIAGVAFWLSPAHPMITDEDRDAAGWREVGAAWGSEAFARFKAFAADIGEVAGPLAAEPHWKLAWLGVEPGQQGRGIASTLVRHVITRADAEGVACQLFTFAPRNVPIYEHLGFRVTRETTLPRSGLWLWVMARPPIVQP